ncbi:Argininosuccinate synthase [Nakaseomyces glabratus]|uniref:Argininosuccinate synthase n=1 Tax=Candida glabrata TaxID=5478 RepID=A0A0W0E1B4_CANGB|nr:Argininosuccinate synthase [Nakaseomyces glabratus]KTA99321.1 Argininosuccinate synthase [Nakaseomyces glabratus]KTB01776.1 Argininosuccinate synthase [Nakaseomyces glabratus]KTB17934.1 Argininosuccinate synthase [Nakaseomyces glabratus]
MSKGKVCLAYSGGLDTSIILAWLLEQGYEVVAFMADVGQEEDFEAARAKALKIGATKVVISDVREQFVKDIIFPAVQVNAVYEDVYLLGTSLARPVIAKAQIDVAEQEGCFAVSHGCTGKGNDQIRFELSFYALKPDVQVIAPWRLPEFFNRFAGRKDLLDYAAEKGIPVAQTKAKPWSTDENMAHISYEAGILEDPNTTPPKDMWKLITDPMDAPNTPQDITLDFEKGIPVKLTYKDNSTGKEHVVTDALELALHVSNLGRANGVGRIDIVENRYINLKSRGCYEQALLTILRKAHVDLEGLVLDKEVRQLRDQFVTTTYSKLLYNGSYFTPECEFIRAMIEPSQKTVNGTVRLSLYKGNVIVLGRYSNTESLYDATESSMDELTGFLPTDTTGFIAIQAIRVKKFGEAKKASGEKITL